MPRLIDNDFLKYFIKGIVLVILLAIFGYFGKDVLIKFTDGATSFSHSKEKNDVLDSPSIAICFDPPMKSTAEKRYNLSANVIESFFQTATSNYSESIPKIMNESFYELGKDFIFEKRNYYSKEAIETGSQSIYVIATISFANHYHNITGKGITLTDCYRRYSCQIFSGEYCVCVCYPKREK